MKLKANEYFKKMGWNISNIRLAELEQNKEFNEFYYDLKKIIESHELIESYGGLSGAKVKLNSLHDESRFKPKLKQAIADVESCM